MARLLSIGAELQSATSGMEWLTTTGSGVAIDTATKRAPGLASIKITSSASASNYIEHKFSTTEVVAFSSFFMNFTAFPTDTRGAIVQHLNAAGTCIASIAILTTGQLRLYDGNINGTQRGSDSTALSTGVWYEIQLNTNNGAGTEIEARVAADGATPSVFASGAMTSATNTEFIDIGMPDFVANMVAYVDDIRVNDNSGTAENSYPSAGEYLVLALPTGAGDNAAPTGIFSYINEIPPSNTATASGTDIVELKTANDLGEYNMTDSATLGLNSYDIVTHVMPLARIRGATASAASYNLRLKSAASGTTTVTSDISVASTTPLTNPNSTGFRNMLISHTDPTTGVAWTPTGTNSIDNMQVGVQAPDATPDLWVLWLGAYVGFVNGTAPSALAKYVPPQAAALVRASVW